MPCLLPSSKSSLITEPIAFQVIIEGRKKEVEPEFALWVFIEANAVASLSADFRLMCLKFHPLHEQTYALQKKFVNSQALSIDPVYDLAPFINLIYLKKQLKIKTLRFSFCNRNVDFATSFHFMETKQAIAVTARYESSILCSWWLTRTYQFNFIRDTWAVICMSMMKQARTTSVQSLQPFIVDAEA